MDFHSLSRKDLQALCKKNMIPANMTNVAMADALGALQQVEGLDEFLNLMESDIAERFPDEKVVGTPQILRTAGKTSTRRKFVREERSKVSTRVRRGARAGLTEGNDQENKDLNGPATPAMPTSRTRAPAISTRRKKETHMQEDEKSDAPKTPVAPPSTRISGSDRSVSSKVETTGGTAVQRTRRSVRLLEKSLANMRLMVTKDIEHVKLDEISKEMVNVSHQFKDSAKTKMGTSVQTASAVDSENTDDVDVTSQEKNIEYKCQSQDSQSKVQLDSEASTSSQSPFEEVNCSYYSEQHDSNPKLELGSATYNDSIEVLESCDESEVEFSNRIEEVKLNDESVDEGPGVLFEFENSIDFSNPESKFCSDAKQDVPAGASDDVTEQDIAGSPVSSINTDPISPEKLVEINTDNQDKKNEIENSIDFSNLENKFCSDAKQDVPVGASDDVTEQDIAGSPVSSINTDPISAEKLVEINTDNQDEKNEIENSIDFSNLENKFCSDAKQDVPVGASDDVTVQDIAGPLAVSSSNAGPVSPEESIETNTNDQDEKNEIENSIDFSNPENKFCSDAEQDVPVGASDSTDVAEQDIAGSLAVPHTNTDPVNPEELIGINTVYQDDKNEYWNVVDGYEMPHTDGSPAKLKVRNNPLLVNPEKLEARGKPESSDSLTYSEESKEVLEKLVDVPQNSVADLQPGDIEFKMDDLMLNSEILEARGEHETSDLLLSDSEESKEVVEKIVEVSETVAYLRPRDVEVKMDSLKVDYENLEAKREIVEESEALIKSDVIPGEIALAKPELLHSTNENEGEIMEHRISLSVGDEVTPLAMTQDSICEQKTNHILIQSVSANHQNGCFPCLVQSQSKENANEVQTAQEIQENDDQKILKMRENLSTDKLSAKSIGELRKMFKTMSLNAKTSSKNNNGAKVEMERKRTALLALPENRMATSEAEDDA